MSNNKTLQKTKYFTLRNFTGKDESKEPVTLPSYVKKILPSPKDSKILDIGCGLGRLMFQLKHEGYNNVQGIDISEESINFCKGRDLRVSKIDSITDYCSTYSEQKFDLIIMTHVIEHIKKDEIIATLGSIKNILAPGGKLYLTTPNAQARTGCYWAYEDFTHETVFTSGSIQYVLNAAGFATITFVDKDGTDNARFKLIKKTLLKLFTLNDTFWNKITGAGYHQASETIYTWELKVTAK